MKTSLDLVKHVPVFEREERVQYFVTFDDMGEMNDILVCISDTSELLSKFYREFRATMGE